MLLEGKTAIVAGAGPGLGREVALLFAEHGANVVLGARRLDRTEAVAEEVRAAGGRAEAVELDVTDAAACQAAVDRAVSTYGSLDILINNAFDTGDFSLFEEADFDNWRRTMDINLWGTLQMTRAASPHLASDAKSGGNTAEGESGNDDTQAIAGSDDSAAPSDSTGGGATGGGITQNSHKLDGGRIVMINSLSAWRPKPHFTGYTISKAALQSATESLAVELGPLGIRVNGIHPGYIWGDSVELYFKIQAEQRGVTPQEAYEEVAAETSLSYLPPAKEIAGSVLFLASDLAAPVTGQSLGVTCGHQT